MRSTFERIGDRVLRALAPQEKAQACAWAPGVLVKSFPSYAEYRSTTTCAGTRCYIQYNGSSVQLGTTCF